MLHHVEIQYGIATYLGEHESRPLPLAESIAVPEPGETVEMVDAGRRALEHIWEATIWRMMEVGKVPDAQIRAANLLYRKALEDFDRGRTPGRTRTSPLIGRPWDYPEFTRAGILIPRRLTT